MIEFLNKIFFPVWYFFEEYFFTLWAFLILIGVLFSIIYQFWKRP